MEITEVCSWLISFILHLLDYLYCRIITIVYTLLFNDALLIVNSHGLIVDDSEVFLKLQKCCGENSLQRMWPNGKKCYELGA
jgi:hypothetical protein